MMTRDKAEILSQKILAYLQRHPCAGDTLEGIAMWWLEQQRIDEAVEEVAEAMELLLSKGEVYSHESQAGAKIYRIKNG